MGTEFISDPGLYWELDTAKPNETHLFILDFVNLECIRF